MPSAATQSKDRVTVNVVLQKGVGAADVRNRIAAAAGLDPESIDAGLDKIRVTVERRHLADLAAIDEVRHVEPYIEPRLMNNVARGILTVDAAQAAGSMDGEGEVVAVADTGFDKGSTTDVHPAFAGRVLRLYALGRAIASDPNGHGTHVCGSVLGDGTMNDGTSIKGAAPKARLVVQSLLDAHGGLGGLPTDLRNLFIGPYRDDGARVHSNSWGSATNGAYDSSASEVDDFIWNHRDCIVCFAAGNDGKDSMGKGQIDPGSVGSPGAAKNCITVGASENSRPDFSFTGSATPSTYGDGWPSDFPSDPIHTDLVADNPEGMAAFSSRGPAANNRIRPDVVAPGTAILSARGRVATGGVWRQSTDPLYSYEGGTSMATPLVAGCAAAIRQYLQSTGISTPSAALVKAMMINGAHLLSGQFVPAEVGPPPDTSQGFGRVDLAATIGPFGGGTVVVPKDEANALDVGQSEQSSVVVAAGETIKVTLVCTDPAGEALQNDLDLVVRTPDGKELHGNMPVGSTDFDRANNVEQVLATSMSAGNVSIVVQCFRSVSPQTYALVVRTS